MAATIDYYVSLNSPWVNFGAARIEAMAARHAAELRIWPVDFATVFAASGGLPLPKRSPQRQAYRMQELARWRDHLHLPVDLQPRGFPADERLAAHCTIAVRETQGHAPAIRLAHRVLCALWQEEALTGERDTVARLIAEVGLDAPAVLALAEDSRWAERRMADTRAALERGVFGAPSYVVGDAIFWGQDRLEFLDRHLARG